MGKLQSRIDFILKHAKGRVLHVGGGASFLHLVLLHELRERLYCLDIMDFSNVYPRFTQANAENMPFQEKLFDTVLLPDVVMHVKDLRKVLFECKRILKDDGFLVVTIPNFGSFWNRIVGTYGETWQKHLVKRLAGLGKPNSDFATAYVYQRTTTLDNTLGWLESVGFEIVDFDFTFQGDDLGAAFVQEGVNLQRGWVMDLRYLLCKLVPKKFREEIVLVFRKKNGG